METLLRPAKRTKAYKLKQEAAAMKDKTWLCMKTNKLYSSLLEFCKLERSGRTLVLKNIIKHPNRYDLVQVKVTSYKSNKIHTNLRQEEFKILFMFTVGNKKDLNAMIEIVASKTRQVLPESIILKYIQP